MVRETFPKRQEMRLVRAPVNGNVRMLGGSAGETALSQEQEQVISKGEGQLFPSVGMGESFSVDQRLCSSHFRRLSQGHADQLEARWRLVMKCPHC